MAQPTFLRNFTLDGVDIGELFVVGTVTMPFMNIERGYYQVGNTSGENLLYTRNASNQITVNGHLVKDHTGLSVSETKDLLVAQLMSEDTMRLVFDGQPDRYYNVVYEGLQEYDATDLDFTPLTLTFTCPDGVAHSIADDTWINVAPDLSLGDNWLPDSEFETNLIWSEDLYVTTKQINSRPVVAMDFTDETLEGLGNFEHNYLADDLWFEFDEALPVGYQVYMRCDYGTPTPLIDQTGNPDDKDRTLSVQVETYDKQNGKLLESFEKDLPDAPIVNVAYAYSPDGVDRFTHFLPQPNLFQNGIPSEVPVMREYQGAVWTKTENQAVTEWGATKAVRYVSSGGTSTIKGTFSTGLLTADSREYIHSIYVKNNAGTAVEISNNLGQIITLQPKESRRLEYAPVSRAGDATPQALQFVVQVPYANPVDQIIDITVWRAKIEESKYGFATVWTDGDIRGANPVDNTTPPWVGYSATDTWQEGNTENDLIQRTITGGTNEGVNVPIHHLSATGGSIANNVTVTELPNRGFKLKVTNVQDPFFRPISGVKANALAYSKIGVSFKYQVSEGARIRLRLIGIDATSKTLYYTGSGQVDEVFDFVKSESGVYVSIDVLDLNANVGLLDAEATINELKICDGEPLPYTVSSKEVNSMYSWSAYGTMNIDHYAPLVSGSIWAKLTKAGAKAFKIRLIQRGNTHTLMTQPTVRFAVSPTIGYARSRKTWRQAIEIENYGTTTAYPVFEITNKNENGLIGIVNDDGGVLQFGNEENVDLSEPVKNEDGYHYDWSGNSKPSGTTVNGGHISQYPNMQNNPDTPNKVMGNWDYSKKDVIRPAWSSSYVPSAWSGMTIATPVKTPTTGLKTGSFEVIERLDFKTNVDRRGRYELVVITDSNDIIMSGTIRDSDANGNEVLYEVWYGSKLLKTIRLDVNKIQGGWFRMTMSRDTAGKKFTWKLENIAMKQDSKGVERITPVYSVSHTYNSPTENKAPISHTSRWLLKYNDGNVSKRVLDKTTYTMKSKEALNIRTGAGTNYRSVGLLPKNKTFTTTQVKTGQKIINNNKWYYVSKGSGIPTSGWVSGYYLSQTKKVDSYKTVVQSAIVDMQVTDSLFRWTGSNKQKETKNPFRAGDKIVIDTYTKQIFVNGVEREDLASIGNQWNTFAFDSGTHYLKFINSNWQANTMEVKVLLERRYH